MKKLAKITSNLLDIKNEGKIKALTLLSKNINQSPQCTTYQ
jgi:hypothetical protein